MKSSLKAYRRKLSCVEAGYNWTRDRSSVRHQTPDPDGVADPGQGGEWDMLAGKVFQESCLRKFIESARWVHLVYLCRPTGYK